MPKCQNGRAACSAAELAGPRQKARAGSSASRGAGIISSVPQTKRTTCLSGWQGEKLGRARLPWPSPWEVRAGGRERRAGAQGRLRARALHLAPLTERVQLPPTSQPPRGRPHRTALCQPPLSSRAHAHTSSTTHISPRGGLDNRPLHGGSSLGGRGQHHSANAQLTTLTTSRLSTICAPLIVPVSPSIACPRTFLYEIPLVLTPATKWSPCS